MTIRKSSETWQAVQKWAIGQIADLQAELEKEQTEAQTLGLRGQIKALRALLALAQNEPEVEVPAQDDYGRGQDQGT